MDNNNEQNKLKSTNFEFILNTEFEKHYEDLVNDEIIFNKTPTNRLVYIDCSRIAEEITRKIKVERFEDDNANRKSFKQNSDELKKCLKEYPIEKFDTIRKNGNSARHPRPKYTATVEEIFKEFHECLLWYFRFENIQLDEKYNISFIIPSNKFVNEKKYFEIIDKSNKRIEEFEKEIREKDKKISELTADVNRRDEIIISQTIKIENLEIERRKSNKNQEENEELKNEIEKLKSKLKEYEIGNNVLREEIQCYSEELTEKHLDQLKDSNVKIDNDLSYIDNGIKETAEKIKSFKGMLKQDNTEIKESRYPMLYKAFVSLQGESLRRIYVTLDKLNIASLLITGVKNKLNKSNSDELQKFINDEAKKLEVFSDDEIKIKLYYKLIKICGMSSGCIAEEKQFKNNLDEFVDFAYNNIKEKKDFIECENKLETINFYYINKIISDFQKKYNDSDNAVQEKLINEIYDNFENLPIDKKRKLYDKLGIKSTSEDSVKTAMTAISPSILLSTLVSIGGFASYTTLSSIIFGLSQLLGVTFSFGVYTSAASLLSFLTGPFMIILLIANGIFIYEQGKKQKAELVPMILMQICISELSLDESNNYKFKYNKLVEVWNEKKEEFKVKNLKKEKEKELIIQFVKGKEKIESEYSKVRNEIEEFKKSLQMEQITCINRILQSVHITTLKSYNDYKNCNSQLNGLDYEKIQNRNKGLFGRIISQVKDGTKEYFLKQKIQDIKTLLLNEAMDSQIFDSYTKTLKDIEKEINEKVAGCNSLKDEIENEKVKISLKESRVEELERYLKIMKDEMFDIDCYK